MLPSVIYSSVVNLDFVTPWIKSNPNEPKTLYLQSVVKPAFHYQIRPLGSRPAARSGRDQHSDWPGSTCLRPLWSPMTPGRCPCSPAASDAPVNADNNKRWPQVKKKKKRKVCVLRQNGERVCICEHTVAISSVFLSFSSHVMVISWMSFSDSCSFSFSSGAFMD